MRKEKINRVLPMLKLVMINDPNNEGRKRLIPAEFLTDNYIRIDEEEDFIKYFHPMYHRTVIPYLGTHYVGFIHKKHPFFIKSEYAITKKLDIMIDSGDERFLNSLLKEKNMNEKNMSIKELESFVVSSKKEKKQRVAKEKLVKDSGVEKIIRREFLQAGKSIYDLTVDELKALIMLKKGGN